MLKQSYQDRLDDMLMPDHGSMQFLPGDATQEVNRQTQQALGDSVDKESPARIARHMEKESTHYTAV